LSPVGAGSVGVFAVALPRAIQVWFNSGLITKDLRALAEPGFEMLRYSYRTSASTERFIFVGMR
jgi:hypothetical protein